MDHGLYYRLELPNHGIIMSQNLVMVGSGDSLCLNMLKWRQVISWTNADFSTRRISFMKTHFKLINCKSEVTCSTSANLKSTFGEDNFLVKVSLKVISSSMSWSSLSTPQVMIGWTIMPFLIWVQEQRSRFVRQFRCPVWFDQNQKRFSKMKFLWHGMCVCFGQIFQIQIWICKRQNHETSPRHVRWRFIGLKMVHSDGQMSKETSDNLFYQFIRHMDKVNILIKFVLIKLINSDTPLKPNPGFALVYMKSWRIQI